MPRVWLYHRKKGDPFAANVDKIAAENHLYSPALRDGRDYSLEIRMAKLEAHLSKLWPRLAYGYVDLGNESIRKSIALYVAIQFLRHPDQRKQLSEARRRLFAVFEQPRGPVRRLQIGRKTFDVSPSTLADLEREKGKCDTEAWSRLIQSEATWLATRLLAKRWSIIVMDQPYLVTSDYPVFVASPEHKRFQIAGKDAKIMFPISPSRVLWMDELDEPENCYYQAVEDSADQYNYLTWVNTESFIISSLEIDVVLAGILLVAGAQ